MEDQEEEDKKDLLQFNKMENDDNLYDNLSKDKKKPFKKILIIIIFILCIIALLVIILISILKGESKKECQPGYYLPDDDKECKKCTISNCEICKGNKINNICYSCEENYIPFKENNKTESCESISELKNCLTRDNQTNKCLICNSAYYLVNGKCKPYSFNITYRTDRIDEEIELINNNYTSYIKGMYMNNTNIPVNSFYNFNSIGNYTIYFFMDIETLDSLNKIFYNIKNMVSIHFSPSNFNTLNIKYMNFMFKNCSSLKSLDLSNINTSNVVNMEYMFYECHSLTSINLSSLNTSSVINMEYMFYNCISLT